VVLIGVVVVGAVLVGWLAGGRPGRLAEVTLRGRWLAAAAVAVQVLAAGTAAAGVGPRAGYLAAVLGSSALALLFLLRNRRIPGLALLAVGLACNAIVVAVNGAMPVSIYAAARAGVPITDIAAGVDPRHVVATTDTSLRLFGDVIPIPFPARPEVASVGDVLIAAGLGLLVVTSMRRPETRQRSAPPPPATA
jgi:biotin transporter BioY